jgi:ribosome-associated protein
MSLPDEFDGPDHARPSKSARKREAASLQDLGVELADMPARDLETLDLPEKLLTALLDLKRLPTHGAQVRQRQYIGKLMRGVDPEPLRARLTERKQRHDVEIRRFQKVERWRDRLLSEPAALGELLEQYPTAEKGKLRELLGNAAAERDAQRPPAAARELFAFLRALLG